MKSFSSKYARLFTLFAGFVLAATVASAQLRDISGFSTSTLAANDDGSTGLVSLGFNANFFGTSYSQAYVNNNGNITFDEAMGTYTPFGLLHTSTVIIAPFFADVDTRAQGSGLTTYGTGVLAGHSSFAVNWVNVGVFSAIPIFNTFQLVVVDRSDLGAGNFDFEFNYAKVIWETGTASGGNNSGLGGNSVRVGYSNGIDKSFELYGSGINSYFLDSSATGLIHGSLGTAFDGVAMNGRYDFSVRNGSVVVIPPTIGAVPEPSTYGMIGAGVLLIGALLRRRFSKK